MIDNARNEVRNEEGCGDDAVAGRRRPLGNGARVQRCLGPVSLHEAVLGYETVSRLEQQMLLINIARMRTGLSGHFTVTSSIAATFDYQTNAAILGPFSDIGINVGVSAAENPTLSIVPIQGKQFTGGC